MKRFCHTPITRTPFEHCRIERWTVALIAAAGLLAGCAFREAGRSKSPPTNASSSPVSSDPKADFRDAAPKADKADAVKLAAGWQNLFDGKTLNGWKITDFGGRGEVAIKDGQMVIQMGAMLTGVSWTNPIPKTDYEVELEAMKVDGNDFFCGLTFPVGDSFCSLIVGGWGGGVVGLSSIDGQDASENDTTKYMQFDKNRWYRLRVRVTQSRIETWIDDDKIVDQSIAGRRISLRAGEIEYSAPFGVATWQTTGALRKIRLRRLDAVDALGERK